MIKKPKKLRQTLLFVFRNKERGSSLDFKLILTSNYFFGVSQKSLLIPFSQSVSNTDNQVFPVYHMFPIDQKISPKNFIFHS